MTEDQPAKPKLKKAPRNPASYRAARKKAAREAGRPMISLAHCDVQEGDTPEIVLNRSQNHSRVADYKYAREISPHPERPVR